MWFTKILLEFGIPAVVILIFVTQILIPLFFPALEFFWFFKKKKEDNTVPPTPAPPKETTPLEESVEQIANELDADTQKLKTTKTKVDETINKLSDAKKQSDNNLNNQS